MRRTSGEYDCEIDIRAGGCVGDERQWITD